MSFFTTNSITVGQNTSNTTAFSPYNLKNVLGWTTSSDNLKNVLELTTIPFTDYEYKTNYPEFDKILNEVTKEKYSFPKPVNIKRVGRKTFVYWNDGTFTKISCEAKQNPDPFAAFCIALTKKLYGSTDKIVKIIERTDEEEKRKRQKEANRKANEEKRKIERKKFKEDVEKKRYELAVLRAAEKKLENMEGNK